MELHIQNQEIYRVGLNKEFCLLNATLTVRAHEAGSHQKKGWEQFTDSVIASISQQKEDVVFLLWGGYAKKKRSED